MRGPCQVAHAGGMNGRNSPQARRVRGVLTGLGIVCAVVAGIGGLAMAGAVVIFFVGMSHYGSNK
jgi:hypothetical protein